MRVVISTRHTFVSDKVKTYAREKIERLERFDGRATKAELVLCSKFHGKRESGAPPDYPGDRGRHAGEPAADVDEERPEPAVRAEKPEEATGEVGAAELIVSVAREHAPFVAHADGESLYAAIDLVVDKMERQLRRHKEKLKNRHR